MINKPTTREQAVQNAIYAAEEAIRVGSTGRPSSNWTALARVWALIADHMPDAVEVETLADRLAKRLTYDELMVIEAIRTGDLVTVHPDFVTEAKDAVAFKNKAVLEADEEPEDGPTTEEWEIIRGLCLGTHMVVEWSEEDNLPVHKPGDMVLTRDRKGKQLEFYVMKNGDLVLEKGERDIDRPMIPPIPIGMSAVPKRGVERVSRIAAGEPITEDAITFLRAIVAARLSVAISGGPYVMQRTDVERYAKEPLVVTVTGSKYEVSLEAPTA
jgi:hypothetical protein